jgi:uncharacterized repeat protein (TIGR01451 family)
VDEGGSFDDAGTTAATGQLVEFKIDYSNTGAADPNSVTVTDVVPDGLTYVDNSCSVEPNPCTYNPSTRTITWNFGTVPGGEFPPLTFQAYVVEEDSGTTITNTAYAEATSDSATVLVDNSVIEIG